MNDFNQSNDNDQNLNHQSIINNNLSNQTINNSSANFNYPYNQSSINQGVQTSSENNNLNNKTERLSNVVPTEILNNTISNTTNIEVPFQNNSFNTQTQNYNSNELNNQSLVSNVSSVANNSTEIDDTFVEPKKKPIALITTIILLVLLIVGAVVYYFVIDNPKTIFQAFTNKILDSYKEFNNQEYEKYNAEYSLDFNITTNNQEYEYLYAVLSDFTFNGNVGYDKSQDATSVIVNSNYSDKALPSIHMLTKTSENKAYISIKELYPKIIKIENTDDSSISNLQKVDTSVDDYKQVYNSFLTALKESMANATYSKKYTKLSDKLVKKITINIDKTLIETMITKLLNDEKFIASYAKITNTTETKVYNELNENLSNLENKTEKVSIYLGIINNEFIMSEYDAGEEGQLKIVKDNDNYNFEYSKNYTLRYQGKITLNNSSDQITFSFNIDLLEEKTSIKLNVTTKLDETKGIDELDTNDTISIDEISENDINSIMEKLINNAAINDLLKDTGLDSFLLSSEIKK